ncbi:hypothetical protein [Glycomyces tritici]|uniref:Uncharacterized protein n=1 Tax=Glycomyces tritici TaxID=2665176 RepID=A0ABT7YI12_9ACTN|nr:hypothetical protein [Glycomyces tritici]MDN3238232.1 hypothetical protein [Glycomyces tritici]
MAKRFGRDREFAEADLGLGGGAKRKRRLIPDSPGVAVFSALVTLALAVVLFIVALPGEERALVYDGEEVSSTALCETTGPDGEAVKGACAELGEFETRQTGWVVPAAVAAVVLAALAIVVLAGVPAQVRAARKEQETAREFMTDEDRGQAR